MRRALCRMPRREPSWSRFAMAPSVVWPWSTSRTCVCWTGSIRSTPSPAKPWRSGRPTRTTSSTARTNPESLLYDEVYAGTSPWRLMTPIDHPEPAHCLVSGTGLTHLGSAAHRQAMHGKDDADLTDSMRMFRAGLEGGRPAGRDDRARHPSGSSKARARCCERRARRSSSRRTDTTAARKRNSPASTSIDERGRPRRIGMTTANEFSDHALEKTNYLHLAASKLRTCAIGPELVTDPGLHPGAAARSPSSVTASRSGPRRSPPAMAPCATAWPTSSTTTSSTSAHRRPGDVHVHFYGADALSFGDGVTLRDADVMVVQFDGFGRALRNPLRVAAPSRRPVRRDTAMTRSSGPNRRLRGLAALMRHHASRRSSPPFRSCRWSSGPRPCRRGRWPSGSSTPIRRSTGRARRCTAGPASSTT